MVDRDEEVLELRRTIARLEQDNARLRSNRLHRKTGATVSVPPPFKPLFDEAERVVDRYFDAVEADPARGHIDVGGERYVLVRASSLSIEFLDTIRQLYADRGAAEADEIGRGFLFDIAHSIGMMDARTFHRKTGVEDPIAKLSAGPVHFAYCGWAFVDISPESQPSPDENFVLLYDHPYSFEADAWIRKGRSSHGPVCIMNSGYSSGWCEESFGFPLTAVETHCRACGDEACRFIMAPPDRIDDHCRRILGEDWRAGGTRALAVPTFFERKQVEDALRRSEKTFRRIVDSMPLPVWLTRADDGTYVLGNAEAQETFYQASEGAVVDARRLRDVFHREADWAAVSAELRDGRAVHGREVQLETADGSALWGLLSCQAIEMPDGDEVVLVAVYDISERKAAEKKARALNQALVEASRRAGMAEIATHVLHNAGNVLNSVGVAASGLVQDVSALSVEYLAKAAELMTAQGDDIGRWISDDPQGKVLPGFLTKLAAQLADDKASLLRTIERLVEKVNHIKQVLDVQQRHARVTELKTMELAGELMDDALSLHRESVTRHNVEITRRYSPMDPFQTVRSTVLQVLVNLIANAKDAVLGQDRRSVVLSVASDDEWVSFSVEDNGSGIEPEVVERIFEHGFSTKPEGHGFGLHSSFLNAESLGGRLEVASDGPGHGATFTLRVPRRAS